MKHAVFVLGEEQYGMDIMNINIIEKSITIEAETGLSGNFLGKVNLRGDIIPVYSLRRRLGLNDAERTDETRFIISSSGAGSVAYEVDMVVEIVELEEEQLFAVPSIAYNADNQFMKNIINYNGRLVVIFEPDKILTEKEQALVDKILKK